MPIYEYSCKKCGKQFEVLIRKRGDEPGKCPGCGARDIKKAFSTFGVSMGNGDLPAHCKHCESPDASCPSGACPYA